MHADPEDATTPLLAGVAAVAGSYAAAGSTPRFVAAPVSGVVVSLTPDVVVRYAILLLGKAGEHLGFALALALTVGLFAGVAALGRRFGDGEYLGAPLSGAWTAGLGWFVAAVVTRAPVAAVGAGLAGGVAVALLVATEDWSTDTERTASESADSERTENESADSQPTDGQPADSQPADSQPTDSPPTDSQQTDSPIAAGRRRLLAATGSLAGFSLLSFLVGRQRTQSGANAPLASVVDDERGERLSRTVDDRLATAAERSLDVDSIPPLVSERFYEVDVSAVNPSIGADGWSLSIAGAVEEELAVDYDDLLGHEPAHRFATLRCVGEPLNGHLMDNALWTGVPVARLLERARPQGRFVVARAADQYFEEFPLAALEESLLAYGMNGRTLPRRHGYPVRVLVPGHWGEINVKWLTELEVTRDPVEGYWEQRGWHGTGPVNTVAKLWSVDRRDGDVRVAGHAYAGTRGVTTVEVSTDGGATWAEAALSEPLPDSDVWRQWAYEWSPEPGSHEVVVRAVDGEGRVQVRDEHAAFPSGATGWVSKTVDV